MNGPQLYCTKFQLYVIPFIMKMKSFLYKCKITLHYPYLPHSIHNFSDSIMLLTLYLVGKMLKLRPYF